MTNWNHDLSQAPRDGSHVILAMPNKTTLRSYWCEPKGEPAHWCMLSHKNEPVAWMAWPEHPFTAAPGDAAVTLGNDLREPVAAEQGQIIREGDAPRETGRASGDASGPDTDHQFAEPQRQQGTDGGEIAAVKVIDRLANAAGVEPSPSDHFILEDVGGGA